MGEKEKPDQAVFPCQGLFIDYNKGFLKRKEEAEKEEVGEEWVLIALRPGQVSGTSCGYLEH